jgi:hypothetical protein
LDFSRLRNGEIVAAASGLALFIFMFFHWFGGGVSAWDALQDFSGFLIALAAVSGVALGVLAAAGQRINLPFQRGVGTLVLGKLAVLLILWRILANPGDPKVGIFLGLIAAAGIAVGAWMALREDGFEPLVSVPGGRTTEAPTTVASATAPAAATPRPATAPGGSRSGRSTAAKSRSGGGTAKKSRSGGGKSSTTKMPGKKKSTTARSKSGSSTRSKSGASSRSKSSGSSRSKSKGSSRSKSSASSRTKSSGTRSRSKSSGSRAPSKSSGTRRRASGGRK